MLEIDHSKPQYNRLQPFQRLKSPKLAQINLRIHIFPIPIDRTGKVISHSGRNHIQL
jgi:hypothetical protein